MKAQYWRHIGWGMVVVVVILGLLGGSWAFHRHNHVAQTRCQAAFLAELSGHDSGVSNSDRNSLFLREMVTQMRTRFAEEVNPEAAMMYALDVMGLAKSGTSDYGQSSSILALARKQPGYITAAMAGNTAPAQELEAKWLRDRHIRFFPYGFTLMLVFLLGQVVVFWLLGRWTAHKQLMEVRYEQERGLKEIDLLRGSLYDLRRDLEDALSREKELLTKAAAVTPKKKRAKPKKEANKTSSKKTPEKGGTAQHSTTAQ